MISIGLCGVAFLACLYMGRSRSWPDSARSGGRLPYGIVRANLPDGFSHLIFDAGVLGLYAAQLTGRQPVWQRTRSEDCAPGFSS